jgi:hypothetical protein
VKRFYDDPKYSIFLISLRAGGVGLNLTCANHALLVDPWWNPAVYLIIYYSLGKTKPLKEFIELAKRKKLQLPNLS